MRSIITCISVARVFYQNLFSILAIELNVWSQKKLKPDFRNWSVQMKISFSRLNCSFSVSFSSFSPSYSVSLAMCMLKLISVLLFRKRNKYSTRPWIQNDTFQHILTSIRLQIPRNHLRFKVFLFVLLPRSTIYHKGARVTARER